MYSSRYVKNFVHGRLVMRRRGWLSLSGACFIATGLSFAAQGAWAAESPVARPSLMHLARQLVDSVDYNFERADDYLDMVNGRENFKTIPDGEVLLLQMGVGGRGGPKFPQPLLAIRRGDDVLISLFDFVSIAQFAIDVKPPEKIAQGWFVREDQKFHLDANPDVMTITADGETYPLAEGDVDVDDADMLVRSTVLAKVFKFQSDVSVRYQRINVMTEQKWPALEKLARLRKKGREYLPPATLPRQEEPYEMVSVPNIDVSTTYNFDRAGGTGTISKGRSHSIVAAGDLAGHTLRANITGDDIHTLQSLNATLKKESDRPDLLGRLKARKYEFGDISAVNVTHAVGSRMGTGFLATNRNPYITSDATTEIEGDVPPGWDVELYRGSQYLDIITGAEGRYRFQDVRLFGGENRFRIVKYGPLGEIEEEEIPIYSTPRQFTDDTDLYEFSVSAAETNVWTRSTSHDQDKYTPIIAGNYEKQLAPDTTGEIGLFTRQEDGQQKAYVNAGTATYIADTILNADVTADVDGSFKTSATARRTILGQAVTADVGYTADDYAALNNQSIPSEYTWGLGLRGPLPTVFDYSLGNYTATTTYRENDRDESEQRSRLLWSKRLGGLSVNSNLDHMLRETPLARLETLEGRTGVSGTLGRTRWRASADYNIDPEWHINSYNLDLSRRLADRLTGRLALSNVPENRFTEGKLSLSWRGDHMTLSPGVAYNTNNDLAAYISANFGLSYDPHSNDLAMRSTKLTDFGGISAFVYLDKDGDLTFSEGDEPLPDAVVEAVHSSRKGVADENGEVFIPDIASNLLTDVKLNEHSFYDPFMVPGTKGVSILPRQGHAARIEFPVHNGGELDGTIYVAMQDGKDRSAKNLRVYLYEMNGQLAHSASVSFDGFYLFQKIHPGDYWLLVDARDAQNQELIRPLPQKLSFGYEGTLIYNHKILLRKAGEKEHDVPTTIGEDYAPYLAANPGVNVNAIKGNLVLNFGAYRSRALMSVVWYKLKMFNGGLIRDAQLLTALSDTNPVGDTGLHILRAAMPGLTMEEAWNRCYSLISKGMDCKVEMLPTGLESAPHAGQQAQLLHTIRG